MNEPLIKYEVPEGRFNYVKTIKIENILPIKLLQVI